MTDEALRLRIPEPARGDRPAERVRFISPAGEMKRDPELTPLRSDPRFVRIVGKQSG